MAHEGPVKWFSDEIAYGFISPDDGGEDLFVHHTGIVGDGLRAWKKAPRSPTRWHRAGR